MSLAIPQQLFVCSVSCHATKKLINHKLKYKHEWMAKGDYEVIIGDHSVNVKIWRYFAPPFGARVLFRLDGID